MARSKSPLQIQLEYYPVKGLFVLLNKLPRSWRESILTNLLQWVLLFMPKRRKIMKENIAFCFPQLSAIQQAIIARQSVRNLARGFSLYGKIPELCQKGMDEMVETEGFEHIQEAFKKGKGMITFTAHYGNWELMAIHVTRLYPQVAMLVRPLDNPRLDQLTTQIRSSGGGGVITNHRVLKDGIKLLRQNGILGILIDQNLAGGGLFVDFFGRPAATTSIVSVLARRTGCAILPMYNRWEGNKIRIICQAPLTRSAHPDSNQAIAEDTQTMTTIVEGWIREDPGQWFWLHNRWKRRPQEGDFVYTQERVENRPVLP